MLDLDGVYDKIERYREEMVEFQKELTAIPAISPGSGGEGEYDKAQLVRKEAEKIFDEIEEYDAPDPRAKNGVRPNIAARLYGEGGKKTLWIMAHMDVVPPGDLSLWETDPFKAEVKDGKIFGRGVEDDQQPLVGALFAAKALKELKIKPKYDLVLLAVADEECGSDYGLKFMLEEHGNLFRKDDLYLVPDAGIPDGTLIEIAEKSLLWIKFRVKGEQAHASMPEIAINAHRFGARLICALDEKLHEKFADVDGLFYPPISTFEPTKKEANVPNINTIPGGDVFYFDCRVLPKYSLEEVLSTVDEEVEKMEKETGIKVELEFPNKESSPPTPEDSPVVELLSRSIEKVTGKKPSVMGVGGGTVAAIFRVKGYPAAVWFTIDDTAHQPNEYCVIDNMVTDAKVFATMLL